MPPPIPGHPPTKEKKPSPEAAAKLIKKREGYVNYYFNELNRDQIWKMHQAAGDFTTTAAEWKLVGDLENVGPVEITLGEKEVTASWPSGNYRIDLSKDLDEQRDPPKGGGLLLALHLWQRMLRTGPEKFGEVYYLGRLPMIGRTQLGEVLVGTHQVMEARFLFDGQAGRLAGMDLASRT